MRFIHKLIGQFGDYEEIFQLYPQEADKMLFIVLSIAFDVSGKNGFVIVVNNREFDMLRYIPRALLSNSKTDLVFLERFKISISSKELKESD